MNACVLFLLLFIQKIHHGTIAHKKDNFSIKFYYSSFIVCLQIPLFTFRSSSVLRGGGTGRGSQMSVEQTQ